MCNRKLEVVETAFPTFGFISDEHGGLSPSMVLVFIGFSAQIGFLFLQRYSWLMFI